ncbi:hypothetical protein [Hymenobacter sp. BRD67]|uniref:hypothetical protein n=1 Tax=Hymenobacter sp. BRD67 TaxID=2675877 RepID=UPI001566EFE6|nr:hypothetical protein [Hymenobacter sp. BRD67]QKG55126.1 hypothetical protein GKZ67_22160 [Hymenobacter sp. BRD67]
MDYQKILSDIILLVEGLYIKSNAIDEGEIISKEFADFLFKNHHANSLRWKNFVGKIKAISGGFKVQDDTSTANPGKTLLIILNKSKEGKFTHVVELVVNVSLLGDYYCMFFKRTVFFEDSFINDISEFNPIIYFVPIKIYEEFYYKVRNAIEVIFNNYKFIPYPILNKRIKNLSTGAIKSISYDDNIYTSLFSLDDIAFWTVGEIEVLFKKLIQNIFFMIINAQFCRTVASFFLLELVSTSAIPSFTLASVRNLNLIQALDNSSNRTLFPNQHYSTSTVTCLWQPMQADKQQQCQFTLAMAKNGQEIENQYITNKPLYTHTIQYLGGDIARDVYLHLPGQPDSTAANSATYLRQYGATGHSTVLLTFPVAEKLLRQGCRVTFRSRQLALQDRQFVFTARDFKHIHQK